MTYRNMFVKYSLLLFFYISSSLTFSVQNRFKNQNNWNIHFGDSFLDDSFGAIDEISLRKSYNLKEMENILANVCDDFESEVCAQEWLKVYNTIYQKKLTPFSEAEFDFQTDMNKVNEEKSLKLKLELMSFEEIGKKLAQRFRGYPYSIVVERQLNSILTTSESHDSQVRKKVSDTANLLNFLYSNATSCPQSYTRCLSAGENGVEEVFNTERDYDKLADVWKSWRDVTRTLKDPFERMVKLSNVGARENGFPDIGYFERSLEEDPNLDNNLRQLYQQILPFYEQLHAYVRFRLLQKYPGRFDPDGPIPAHLFGNAWAQHWNKIFPLVEPYSNVESLDVSEKIREMHSEGVLDRKEMFQMAESFFTSLGLPPMTEDFWSKSVPNLRPGRLMECHPTASDMHDGKDYRIKMCTSFDQCNLLSIHHEMGHVQYYMAYSKQPTLLQKGANSAFHEAVGDTIALSVMTPNHLQRMGLLDNVKPSKEFDINYLMRVALEKVAFIPFGLTVDTWRWNVFNGSITPDTYNKEWWNLRSKLQGIMPPVPRTKKDVDALAKYHISANIGYIRYFQSFMLQFQFYESLCKTSGHRGPLHHCDFYGSKEAGEKLKSVLSLGGSKPWQEAMEMLTGIGKISLDPLLNYFQPLYDWLKVENARNGVKVGWNNPELPVE